jgi:shikimate kinase
VTASDRRHVVLVGLMGAGKTTVGRALARRIGRPFVDTDELVETAAATTIAEIFAAEGEAGFRARERVAVADACASPEPLVISVGGGAVLDPENRGCLRGGGVVVWLRAPADVLAARVGAGTSRPLLSGAPPAVALGRLAELREPAYQAVADVVVETAARTIEEVVTAVEAEVASWAA